jgi:hypothetical protein
MYGPPPAASQIVFPAGPLDVPGAWVACLLLGVALLGLGLGLRRRAEVQAWLLILAAQVVLLTAPASAMVEQAVWGAWPTVDKAGSYLFYLDGVHLRPFSSGALDDPALALIGIHVGHLWLTATLDLLLSPHGAFNAQALLQVWLGWACAWLLLRDLGAKPWVAALCAMPFALGLHVFRDVTWFTIEKSAVFGIPLFLWAMNRARQRGGRWVAATAAILLGCALFNWYLALVNLALLGVWLLGAHSRRALLTAGACALALLPLVAVQALLLQDAGALADPQRFLWERAALDVLSLWPPRWYHLELWRVLNLPLMLLGAWGLWLHRDRPEARWGAAVVLLLGLLSIGPMLLGARGAGVPNPLFMAAWKLIPGFWRIARPEFMFEGAWLVLLASAALTLQRWRPGWKVLLVMQIAMLAGWAWGVRGHPAYPGFTEPVEVELSEGWQQEVFAP